KANLTFIKISSEELQRIGCSDALDLQKIEDSQRQLFIRSQKLSEDDQHICVDKYLSCQNFSMNV
ncbi:hypothetical protein A2U01_0090988, partial [Trifolium medium]|nr:hypothetical protein [Trifolium medium]